MSHSNIFDRYLPQESSIHRLNPQVKVGLAIFLIISNALLPDGAWLGFAISWGGMIFLTLLARLPWHFALKRSLIVLPFALAGVTALFSLPGKTLAIWHLGAMELVLTDTGLLRFESIILRAWLSIQAAIWLVTTTPFPDLIHALEHFRLPKMLVTVIAFLYRYMSVLSDEALRMLRARQARSAVLLDAPNTHKRKNILWQARTAGYMVGQLFLRSYERSDRIYSAMLARGYDGHLRTLNRHEMSARDRSLLALALLLLISLQLLTRIF